MVKSLDQLEMEKYLPYSRPMDTPFEEVELEARNHVTPQAQPVSMSLDGTWLIAEGGYSDERTDITKEWPDAFEGNVPSSIHTMLFKAGRIPDPLFARNDSRARENSHRTWWFRKEFDVSGQMKSPVLKFDGVCYRAQFWLNGCYLGCHSGMFGGPDYHVEEMLREHNILIVRIFDAPSDPRPYSGDPDAVDDAGWQNGVVINCVYGWHYASIPSRGIWRSVHIDSEPETRTERPFFVTVSTDGTVDLILQTCGRTAEGNVRALISPKNFDGGTYGFEKRFVKSSDGDETLHYRFRIPDPHIWWPNGAGEHYLYSAYVEFAPDGDVPARVDVSFGIRTVEMGPQPGGPREDTVNLTYIINGRPIFIKGTNWCTTDVLLRFTKERYRRFLTLARDQHVQLLRAWGGGMPESDDFYDICDELGIMVRQEWPTCWDSDRKQPFGELSETVVRNLPRIRNHPSLVTLAGGNESDKADSPAMTEIARMSMKYDGTRVFHKSSPFSGFAGNHAGGIIHDYCTYWRRQPIDDTLRLEAAFVGEFGAASSPNYESVMRYLPDSEKDVWPLPDRSAFWHHMPKFNAQTGHEDRLFIEKHVREFTDGNTLRSWIDATQLLQATIIRHLIEKFRSRWPYSTGICYYKLTDVYPAASWSTIDYYGVPKLSYHVIRQAYAPLHAALVFDSVDEKTGQELPVFLIEDNGCSRGRGTSVSVRAFGSGLDCIYSKVFPVPDSADTVIPLGSFAVTAEMEKSSPLFITADVIYKDGTIADRTFWWLNFKGSTGCLFRISQATLETETGEKSLTLRNVSDVPAVGVIVENPTHDTEFTVSDGVMWINPGETKTMSVSHTDGLTIRAFNIPLGEV